MARVIEKSKTQFFTRNPLREDALEIEFGKMKIVVEKLEREIELLKIMNLGQKLKNEKVKHNEGKWP